MHLLLSPAAVCCSFILSPLLLSPFVSFCLLFCCLLLSPFVFSCLRFCCFRLSPSLFRSVSCCLLLPFLCLLLPSGVSAHRCVSFNNSEETSRHPRGSVSSPCGGLEETGDNLLHAAGATKSLLCLLLSVLLLPMLLAAYAAAASFYAGAAALHAAAG